MSNWTYKYIRHLIEDFGVAGWRPWRILTQSSTLVCSSSPSRVWTSDDGQHTFNSLEEVLSAPLASTIVGLWFWRQEGFTVAQIEVRRDGRDELWSVEESLARHWGVRQSIEFHPTFNDLRHTSIGNYVSEPAADTSSQPAIKRDDGKPAMSLLPMDALHEVAKCLAFGADKYGRYNWRNGFDWSRLEAAMLRHYAAYQRGEDRDKESGHLHTAHMAVNALFLLAHQLNGYGKDDRYVGTTLGNT